MLYVFVGDDDNNVQLFKTDGTNQGTMKVRLCYLFSSARIYPPIVTNNLLYR